MLRRQFMLVVSAILTGLQLRPAPLNPNWSQLMWGTYGKSGKEPLRSLPLTECETDHLQAILRTERWHLTDEYDDAICGILRHRGVEPLSKQECAMTRQQWQAMVS